MSVAFNADPLRSSRPIAATIVAPVAPLAPAPTAAHTAASAAPAPSRFAELLRQRRTDLPPAPTPAATATPASADTTAHASPDDTSPSDATATPSNAARNAAKARAAAPKGGPAKAALASRDGAPGDEVTNDSHDRDAAAASPAAAERANPRPGTDAVDPRAAAALCGEAASRLASTSTAAASEGTSERSDVDGDSDPRLEMRGTAAASDPHARHAAGIGSASERDAARAERTRDSSAEAARDSEFRAAVAGAGLGERSREPAATASTHDRSIDGLAAALATGSANRTETLPAAAAPVAVTIATPLDAADFGSTFALQVSVLAQDGVQQAELHLNPAEMGPVSIHISLDGSAARVDFAADVAATRHAIERGLPELAGALRDAGFTLAGGGVSSHAGGRSGAGDEAARSARVDGGATPAVAATSLAASAAQRGTRVRVGGVDLYA